MLYVCLWLDYVEFIDVVMVYVFFFLKDTATTEIYTYGHTLSLHDALPICRTGYLIAWRCPEPFAEKFDLLFANEELRRALGASARRRRSEEHTSELQSLMRISYAVFCLKKKNNTIIHKHDMILFTKENTETEQLSTY